MQISREEFRDKNFPGSIDIGNEFEFLVRVDQKYDVDVTHDIYPATLQFEQWLCDNADKLRQSLKS